MSGELQTELAPGRTRHDWLVSGGVLATGAAAVTFLTLYNRRGWSLDPSRYARTWDEYLLVNIGCLTFPAWVFLLTVVREPAERFGFRWPERGAARIALAMFAVMVPLMLIASQREDFRRYYPMQAQVAYSWTYFLYAEIAYGFYMFWWEWFYRGFLTFGLSRAFGATAAVLLQAAAFAVMHYGKPMPEFWGSIVAGLALGWLALRARSFLPGFWLHWGVSVAFDLLAIHGRQGAIF